VILHLNFLSEIYKRLRWGKIECATAFVHPADFDYMNDLRVAHLRDTGESFKIKVSSKGRLVLCDADGSNRVNYGHPEPGRVLFVEERTRYIEVHTMLFERKTA
jgi:hypothetical protein